ncbi:MAG: hypothetical protein J1F12_00305 [Muribaculaceae bacterium]|nr:hypothetical protein [Muribaculaceae bacterium]
MKFFKHIFNYLLAIVCAICLYSCADDLALDSYKSISSFSYNEDGSLNVDVSFTVPEMTKVQTRMGYTPLYKELTLYVLVFEDGTGKLLQSSVAEIKNIDEDKEHSGYTLVTFNTSLQPTDKNAVIHLIASNQPDLNLQLGVIGSESLLRTIVTKEGNEAYWARIPIGRPITSKDRDIDGELAGEILEKLSHVPMVRNFCRVSAEVQGKAAAYFEIDKLYLVNANDRGSVVPYLIKDGMSEETRENNGFVIYYKDEDGKKVSKKYSEIMETGFIGEPPSGTSQYTEDRVNMDGELEIYFYERPFREENRTYVVIQGHKFTETDGEKKSDGETCFYKIDLGRVVESSVYGEFEYYNLVRNFDYHIIITDVLSEGFKTREEAKSDNSYVSNNLTSTVETRDLTWINEGDETIYVNLTKYIYTESRKDNIVEIKGRYINNANPESNYEEAEELNILIEDYATGFLTFVGQNSETVNENGDLIYDGNKEVDSDKKWQHWYLKLKDNAQVVDEAKQQKVIVYRGKKTDSEETEFGLYRTITFTLIRNFRIIKIDTYPGIWDEFDEHSWDWPEDDGEGLGHITREIGDGINAPLTLFFKLEDYLPQSIFPLDFIIESDLQNIQNDYEGTSVVKTVPSSSSLFYGEEKNGTPYDINTTRIQYIKTFSYEDYVNYNGIVRARYRTTTSLSQPGYGGEGETGESETRLMVYNEYFDKVYDDFTRRTTEDVNVEANFNEDIWTDFLNKVNLTTRNRLSSTTDFSPLTDLRFHEDKVGNMSSETKNIGSTDYRYLKTAATGEYFQYEFTHRDNSSDDRIVRIEVTSGTVEEDNIVTAKKANIYCEDLEFTETQIDNDTPCNTMVYETVIRSGTLPKDFTIRISPTEANQCFFEINIYPRYEE